MTILVDLAANMVTKLRDFRRNGKLSFIAAVTLLTSALNANGGEPVKVSVPTQTNARQSLPVVVNSAQMPKGEIKVTLDGPMLPNSPSWSEALRAILLTAIPDKYEDLSHWGKTNEIFGGVRVQQRGFNIRVSERKQTVNHGAWHRYKIELVDPARTLKLLINQIKPNGMSQFQFDIRLASKLRCRADFEHWVLGVKGLNMTVVSEADVQIVAHCQLTLRTESTRKNLLPDLVLEPRVNSVQLFLTNLDVKRIGEIRGDLAEVIGDTSRHDIENLLQAQEGRVARKANESIEKKRNSLRISVPAF